MRTRFSSRGLVLALVMSALVTALIACTGPQGPPGDAGPAGPKGSAGSAGPAGDTGTAGDDGIAGPPGSPGSTGPAGPPGAQGEEGADGATGSSGSAGSQGSAGTDGTAGAVGASGASGPPGPPGPGGPGGPSIALTASSIVPGGDKVFVWGAGFDSGETVSVVVVAGAAGRDLNVVGGAANSSGAFSLSYFLDLSAGVYTIKATGDSGSVAVSPLLVAAK